MEYKSFVEVFGLPRHETSVDLSTLKLDHSPDLERFATEVGGGIFADGLLSLISIREQVLSLGGWEYWLPANARLFGCSGFGLLMATQGNDVWIQVVESSFTIQEFIVELSTPDVRVEELREDLFKQWNRCTGPLPASSVLCPTPALALGGSWDVSTLSVMTCPVYLSFTGQLFAPDSEMPAEVQRL